VAPGQRKSGKPGYQPNTDGQRDLTPWRRRRPLRAEIEAHLALCDGCDTYLDQMRSTIAVLGHVPVSSLSEQAKDELMTAFRGIHTRKEPSASPLEPFLGRGIQARRSLDGVHAGLVSTLTSR
jgi:hypothetical protein